MGTKFLVVTLVVSIVSAIMKNRYKKGEEPDKQAKKSSPAYLFASIVKDISVIVFSALLALWLTNYDEDAKARSQMRSYYMLEMKQNWNIVRGEEIAHTIHPNLEQLRILSTRQYTLHNSRV